MLCFPKCRFESVVHALDMPLLYQRAMRGREGRLACIDGFIVRQVRQHVMPLPAQPPLLGERCWGSPCPS